MKRLSIVAGFGRGGVDDDDDDDDHVRWRGERGREKGWQRGKKEQRREPFVVIFAPPARKNSKQKKKKEKGREKEKKREKVGGGEKKRREKEERVFLPGGAFRAERAATIKRYVRVEIVTCTWRLLNREACTT